MEEEATPVPVNTPPSTSVRDRIKTEWEEFAKPDQPFEVAPLFMRGQLVLLLDRVPFDETLAAANEAQASQAKMQGHRRKKRAQVPVSSKVLGDCAEQLAKYVTAIELEEADGTRIPLNPDPGAPPTTLQDLDVLNDNLAFRDVMGNPTTVTDAGQAVARIFGLGHQGNLGEYDIVNQVAAFSMWNQGLDESAGDALEGGN